jgi:hypothetical protein
VTGIQPGEPWPLADAKASSRHVAASFFADADPAQAALVAALDTVLGKLFADTATIVTAPAVRRDAMKRATGNDDVVISLADAIAKQTETIAAQADQIVQLARLVPAAGLT